MTLVKNVNRTIKRTKISAVNIKLSSMFWFLIKNNFCNFQDSPMKGLLKEGAAESIKRPLSGKNVRVAKNQKSIF